MSDFPPILNTEQAAELLQVSGETIRQLAADGLIPGWRAPRGRWRFSRDGLIAHIAKGNNESEDCHDAVAR
jgi:excisionase family DNA binding protein